MTGYIVFAAMAALAFLALTELVAAALPVLIVITMVAPEERETLAKLLATCDSRRRLRLWPALRLAVRARREQANRADRESRYPQADHNAVRDPYDQGHARLHASATTSGRRP